MVVSSGNTLIGIPRNNVQPIIWAPLGSDKLTQTLAITISLQSRSKGVVQDNTFCLFFLMESKNTPKPLLETTKVEICCNIQHFYWDPQKQISEARGNFCLIRSCFHFYQKYSSNTFYCLQCFGHRYRVTLCIFLCGGLDEFCAISN